MLYHATSLQVCGTPVRSAPEEPPSTLERWSRRPPSRTEWHSLVCRQTQGLNDWFSIPGGGAGRRFNWYAIFRRRADAPRKGSSGGTISALRRLRRGLPRLPHAANAPAALRVQRLCLHLNIYGDGRWTWWSIWLAGCRWPRLQPAMQPVAAAGCWLDSHIMFEHRPCST